MSGKKSRDKGARGEREAAKFLTRLGFGCSRNARNGISTGDLTAIESLPNVHIEVKFGYGAMDIHTADLRKAWEQAALEAWGSVPGSEVGPLPTVLWKPLRKPWRLTWMESFGLVTTSGGEAIKGALLELNEKGGE